MAAAQGALPFPCPIPMPYSCAPFPCPQGSPNAAIPAHGCSSCSTPGCHHACLGRLLHGVRAHRGRSPQHLPRRTRSPNEEEKKWRREQPGVRPQTANFGWRILLFFFFFLVQDAHKAKDYSQVLQQGMSWEGGRGGSYHPAWLQRQLPVLLCFQ